MAAPLADCQILLLTDTMSSHGCTRSFLSPRDDSTLIERVAQRGGVLSVNGCPPLEAVRISHIVTSDLMSFKARAPSIHAACRYDSRITPVFVSHMWLAHAVDDARSDRPTESEYAVPEANSATAPTIECAAPEEPPTKKLRGLDCEDLTCQGSAEQGGICGVLQRSRPATDVIELLSDDDDASDERMATGLAWRCKAGAARSDVQLAAALVQADADAASLALARQLQAAEDANRLASERQAAPLRSPPARNPPPPAGRRRVFSGTSFFLNRLRGSSGEVRHPVADARPPEIDPHEIIWDARCAPVVCC